MEKENAKHNIGDIVRATVLGLLFNLIIVLLLAIVVKYTAVSDTVATVVNQVGKVISLLLGTLIGFRSRRLGWLLGAITGLLFTALTFGVFSLLAGEALFDANTALDFALGMFTGAVSGILAVNIKSMRSHRAPRKARA